MRNVYIVSAKRTAIGSYLGSLKEVSSAELAATVIQAVLDEVKINPKDIDEVILGQALPAGQGQGVARQAAVQGGVDISVPAYSINMVCGSGMKTVMNAYVSLCSGLYSCILAGGVESMSQTPFLVPSEVRSGKKMGGFEVKDHMIQDALTDAFNAYHMGVTAENIVEKYGISREEQDRFAIHSQTKAIAAMDAGRFVSEIVPVQYTSRKGEVTVDVDEYPNRKTNYEKISQLRPVFKKGGTVTAANASGLNDGASCLLLMDETQVKAKKLVPLVRILGIGQAGIDPAIMGLGPTGAIRNALQQANLKLQDMDIIELGEAFAAQSLGVLHELAEEYQISLEDLKEKTNVNGGAIALGHPLGSSGNRIIVSLIHEMVKRKSRYGLASLCVGGGMGTAIIVERCVN